MRYQGSSYTECHLGYRGPFDCWHSGATEITVDGVPSSSMLDDVHQAQVETWEEEADR